MLERKWRKLFLLKKGIKVCSLLHKNLTQRGGLSTALEPKIKTRVVLHGRTRYWGCIYLSRRGGSTLVFHRGENQLLQNMMDTTHRKTASSMHLHLVCTQTNLAREAPWFTKAPSTNSSSLKKGNTNSCRKPASITLRAMDTATNSGAVHTDIFLCSVCPVPDPPLGHLWLWQCHQAPGNNLLQQVSKPCQRQIISTEILPQLR